jgi:hypothetical protein
MGDGGCPIITLLSELFFFFFLLNIKCGFDSFIIFIQEETQ